MEKQSIEKFLNSCDELINCKFLVAEYKLQKLLQELANAQEVCSLVGECLEQFNRDREFSKSFVQDGNGEFMFLLPEEEYKIIALVFCTLVDIDAKKIDFTDFVKRFFGSYENSYQAFIENMIIPFKNLIADAFGLGENQTIEETEEQEEEETEEIDDEEDKFIKAQKIAVQILSQLDYAREDYSNQRAAVICRAIVKTSKERDEEITSSLVYALKCCKAKQIKFLVRELCEYFD